MTSFESREAFLRAPVRVTGGRSVVGSIGPGVWGTDDRVRLGCRLERLHFA